MRSRTAPPLATSIGLRSAPVTSMCAILTVCVPATAATQKVAKVPSGSRATSGFMVAAGWSFATTGAANAAPSRPIIAE